MSPRTLLRPWTLKMDRPEHTSAPAGAPAAMSPVCPDPGKATTRLPDDMHEQADYGASVTSGARCSGAGGLLSGRTTILKTDHSQGFHIKCVEQKPRLAAMPIT